jgi:hypothetical protein
LLAERGLANTRGVSDLLPPSPQRVRAARDLGLRPRSPLLVLAGLALVVWALLGLMPLAAAWLSNALVLAFAGPPALASPALARASGLALLALLGAILLATLGLGPRRRKQRALGIRPDAETIPSWIAQAICALGLGLVVALGLPVLAGAARSVDASPEGLALAWIAWTRWGLLALAMIAGCVGVIERRVAAARLWRALHLSREQARAQARAANSRGG